MQASLRLKCRCGQVRGVARDLSPRTGNHLVCYCRDCQAFARYLGGEGLLDAAGASEIYQLAPAQLSIEAGAEQLRCVRLTPDGMVRWYTGCCRTPVANTMASARAAFAGMLVAFVDEAEDAAARARAFGPVLARGFGRDATGPVPEGTHPGVPLRLVPRMLWFMARGWLAGKHQPSPFYAAGAREPRVRPTVLAPEERAGLA